MLQDHLSRRCEAFTIQWHLTHACDLHCKHCYDRSKQSILRLPQAIEVLDRYEAFCKAHRVGTGITLSGGNPLFYPWFFELYEAIAARGISIAILGNPVTREQLERIVAIQKPRYFQVSLEGLPAHNDAIRGAGFFERVMEFLDLLREVGVEAPVMTTLTDANLDQIIPLGELLRERTDCMSWNRLSQSGEGAQLGLPDKERYGYFLVRYMVARRKNPTLCFKDNLFNILNQGLGRKLFSGCTGFGCGAAFNFFALLPNGEAHACRKFPSLIGHVLEQSFAQIYDGEAAARYRRGSVACDGCVIRKQCGGCMAVSAGAGLDPFVERDPHCFMYD
ncbi:MAG TPA: thio(seleno)oxazole modification radical SAM maturase SbtM [Polyangiales bacterium]